MRYMYVYEPWSACNVNTTFRVRLGYYVYVCDVPLSFSSENSWSLYLSISHLRENLCLIFSLKFLAKVTPIPYLSYSNSFPKLHKFLAQVTQILYMYTNFRVHRSQSSVYSKPSTSLVKKGVFLKVDW